MATQPDYEKTVYRDCINWSNNDHCAKSKCNYCVPNCEDYDNGKRESPRPKSFSEIIEEMRNDANKYRVVDSLLLGKFAEDLDEAYKRDMHLLEVLRCMLDRVVLERPDGTMCYCNPDVSNRMEDFGTSSEYGVCDGESKEVFNESIADALSVVARAQMLLGIANYKKPSLGKEKGIIFVGYVTRLKPYHDCMALAHIKDESAVTGFRLVDDHVSSNVEFAKHDIRSMGHEKDYQRMFPQGYEVVDLDEIITEKGRPKEFGEQLDTMLEQKAMELEGNGGTEK